MDEFVVLQDIADGARKKKILLSKASNTKYLYKESLMHSDGAITYEAHAEELAYLLGCSIGVPVAWAKNFQTYCLSKFMSGYEVKSFMELNEELYYSLHSCNFKTFNIRNMLSRNSNPYWRETIDMLLFDILIGNSDRHPKNFGFTEEGFYPLFDNGSALLAKETERGIEQMLIDGTKFKAVMYTKSRPVLRDNDKLTHYELLGKLKSLFPNECADFACRLDIKRIKADVDCIAGYSDNRRIAVSKFLVKRSEWFSE